MLAEAINVAVLPRYQNGRAFRVRQFLMHVILAGVDGEREVLGPLAAIVLAINQIEAVVEGVDLA